MKKTFLIPYFGTLPNYFDLFLTACGYNASFSFLLVTDQEISFPLPDNVSLLTMTFEELQKRSESKLGAVPFNPYKFSEFRPACGILFGEFLADSDYWGTIETDLIPGDLSEFFPDSVLEDYDKFQTLGHMTLYRNSPEINALYCNPCPGGMSFERTARIKEICYFDETFFNRICLERGVRIYQDGRYADILPQYDGFVMADTGNGGGVEISENQTFAWNHGHLVRIDSQGRKQELIYIHLQKRPMKVGYDRRDFDGVIHIAPQGLIADRRYTASCEVPMKGQALAFQRGRFRQLSLRKLYVKYKVEQTIRYLRKRGVRR